MKLSDLFKPFKTVETSHGLARLYHLSLSNSQLLKDIVKKDAPDSSIKEFLKYVIDFKEYTGEKPAGKERCSSEDISALRENDIDSIAGEYVTHILSYLPEEEQKKLPENLKTKNKPEQLLEILKIYSEYDQLRSLRMAASIGILGPRHQQPDALLQSSLKTLSAARDAQNESIDKLNSRILRDSFKPLANPMLEVSMQTAKVTIKSADLLQKLVDSATVFMETSDKKDSIAKRQYNWQLFIAIFGIWLSVIPAIIGLWYSQKSYALAEKADRENGLIQEKLISLIESQNLTAAKINDNLSVSKAKPEVTTIKKQAANR